LKRQTMIGKLQKLPTGLLLPPIVTMPMDVH
jgi:hypothetical protein